MAKLSDPQKLFIVRALACFDTPTQVAQAAKREFGIELHRRQVAEYDPTKASGREVGAKLGAVFDATRKAFLGEVATIPVANRAVRLRILQRLAEEAERRGNSVHAAALLEQAAKEVGGAFTNRRELTGANGGPIQAATQSTNLTPEAFRDVAKQLLDEV